jgi:hypothetical protein
MIVRFMLRPARLKPVFVALLAFTAATLGLLHAVPAPAPVAVAPLAGPAKRLLTADEIQRVRVREMPRGDKLARFEVLPGAKLAARDAGIITSGELKSLTRAELAIRVLTFPVNTAAKQHVKIVADPTPLVEYRQKVNHPLVASCASAACHGGKNGGALLLFGDPEKEDAALTNFVILQKFEKTIDAKPKSMIDRISPAKSLLLPYMLPREISRTPHPIVPGFTSAARGADDPVYIAASTWMGRTLIPIAPSYDDVDLTTPAPKPAAP